MANAINWFEIPAENFDRAKKFYGSIFNEDLQVQEIQGIQMAFLPAGEKNVGGAICSGEMYKPSANGTLPYLNGGDDLQTILTRVEGAGGKVVVPKTKISEEIGYFSIFFDSEGNKVALHSPG